MVSTTDWGRSPRTSASRPGTRHEASRGLDAGAKGCPVSEKTGPSSEEWAKEGLSRGAWVLRTGWASMVQLTGPAPRLPWLCTGSVQEGSLGETHICEGPGASCAPVHPCRECPRSGNKTAGNGSSPERQTGLPVRIRRDPKWGWSRHSPGSAGCRESSSAARLSTPGMWMARRNLRCFWLQRRRWRASCHMRWERRPPWRLMYATVAVLSVRISACLPCSSPLRRPSARRTASNSRQLMCQCSWGPVHRPDTACPLYVAPQSVAEASVKTTACLDTCSRGTPARRNEGSDHGLKVWQQYGVMDTWCVPLCHAHLGTRLWSQCWSSLIWSNPSSVTAAADAICPRSLWKSFSGAAVLPLNEFRQFNTDWTRSSVSRAVWLTESNSIQRKEILCTGESLLFSQLTRSPNRLRWRSTMSLCSHNWSWDCARISQSSR